MSGPEEQKAAQEPADIPSSVDESAQEAAEDATVQGAPEVPEAEVEEVEDAAEEIAAEGSGTASEGDEKALEGEIIEDAFVPEVIEPEPEQNEELEEALAAHAKLQAEYDKLQARLRTVSKGYRELQEDMSAFRKRVEDQGKTKEERQRFEVVKAFFDPVQNLRRSLAKPGDDIQSLVDGMKIVLHQFTDSLHKLGLREVPGEGAPFDPRVHEALAITPVLEPEQDGKVIMVHTTGYEVNGKVVVAAQVVVGKYEEQPAEA